MPIYRLKYNDNRMFEQIFDQYNRLLYVLAYRYLKSNDEAEDAVQYTFMKLWEQRDNIDSEKSVKSLLVTILKNHILNEIKHRNIIIEKNYEISQAGVSEDYDFVDIVEETDFRSYLLKIIKDLPQQQKKVCLLKIQKGMSNQEIAENMNISVPTVKSHYTQAIKMLRMSIEKIMLIILLSC